MKYLPQDLQITPNLSFNLRTAPTDYDREHGPFVDDTCCEPYEVPLPKKMPMVRNTGVKTLNADGKPYAVCGGNVNWTDCTTALSNINLSEPLHIWYITTDGIEILRWKTPSRTRSKTLLLWQTLPAGASFDEADLTGDDGIGPAWSYLNRSGQHDEKTPIFDFSRKTCPLCVQPRHARNTMVHDFAVAKQSTRNFHLDSIPTSVGDYVCYHTKRKRV